MTKIDKLFQGLAKFYWKLTGDTIRHANFSKIVTQVLSLLKPQTKIKKLLIFDAL